MLTVLTKNYTEPAFCESEILRYAGCKEADGEVTALMHSCMEEIKKAVDYRVCWCEADAEIKDGICRVGPIAAKSRGLSEYLKNSSCAVIFGATLGVEVDRLIAKYGRISPARALMIQAVGAERIESLCDIFCMEQTGQKSRFSSGYGDLSLDVQRDIFELLDCPRRIGLTLNDSLLMSPSKSVTAFVRKEK